MVTPNTGHDGFQVNVATYENDGEARSVYFRLFAYDADSTLVCSNLATVNQVAKTDEWDNATKTLTVNSNPGYQAYANNTEIEHVIINNGVTSIGAKAFGGCTALTSIEIPNSVTSIGENAFQIVPNIVYSGSATGSPWGARSVNGYVDGFLVYSDDTKTNLLACSSQATGTIEIPNSVISIGDYTFYECSGLTSVTIGNSVTSIGADAFNGCTAVTDVYCYPNAANLTWDDGDCNDFKASKATSCHVPANYYDAYVAKFDATVNVTFVGDLPNETIIFNNLGLANQKDLTLGPLTVGNIELNFAQNGGLNSPKFYTTDGGTARIYSGNSMSISAGGATITKIVFNLAQGTPTFDTGSYNATTKTWEGEATTLTLSNEMASGQVRIVSMDVYYSVASPTNPSGSCGANLSWEFDPSNGTLTITGTGAMDDYDYMENQVPWLSSIGSITSVIIPDGVTRIGNCAFYACNALTSIEIPGSVTSIGDEAFSYCSLASVTVNATTPPTLGTDAFAGTAEGLKIYVPASSVDDYKAAWAAYADKITTPTYTVTLKEGTEDADNWTITPPEAKTTGVADGTEIKATYSGTRHVKSVKAVKK